MDGEVESAAVRTWESSCSAGAEGFNVAPLGVGLMMMGVGVLVSIKLRNPAPHIRPDKIHPSRSVSARKLP